LGEHLAQVPLDGARTEEQLRADLRVRQSFASEPCDLSLLWSQFVAGLGDALAHSLAGGQQFTSGTVRERLHADRLEQLVRRSQLCARVDAAILATQPLPVEQMCPSEVGPESRAPQAVDG